MSRTTNTIRNMLTSMGGQIFNNLLRMVCRTVFIYSLGKSYLGISSLYANILTILSVSEMGFSTAITYSLYKPLADHDHKKICSLMEFYKNAYRTVGVAVLCLGICLVPFLKYLMNGATDTVNIYTYYFLYLTQSVVSYFFFAYKATLLIADQKKYISDLITYAAQVCLNLVQIAVLLLFKSFFAYTVVYIFCIILQNLLIAVAVDRKYPYLSEKAERLTKEEKQSVFLQVYATSIQRISTIVGTATDNLVISTYISVLAVGMYDNYYMILSVIQAFISGVFQSFKSSIGNYYATESREQNLFLFRSINLLNRWLVIFCSVCFITLFQPFIQIWIGAEYQLTFSAVIIIVMNFATNYMNITVQTYREASGLFVKGKYRPLATAVLNLGISIILVKRIGLPGVFLGSIISRLTTTWWYDAWILFRYGFDASPVGFYCQCLGMSGSIFLFSAIVIHLTSWIHHPWLLLIGRGCTAVLLVNTCLILVYGRSEGFQYISSKITRMFKKKLRIK